MVDFDNRVTIGHWPEEIYPKDPHIIEQFVQDVKDFSSQYGSDISISYTAYNLTGKPSKFPHYGDFPQAFVMRTYGKWWDEAPSKAKTIMPQNYGPVNSQDYIDVTFEHPVTPIRVSVYETYNPGSVVGIWAGDGEGKWFPLWRGAAERAPPCPRIFTPPITLINLYTKLLRLEFDHSHLEYYTELDAVLLTGISPTKIPCYQVPFVLAHSYVSPSSSISSDSTCSSQRSSRSTSPEEKLPSSSDKVDTFPTPSTPTPSQSLAHITQRVIDMELTTWKSNVDISHSLDELNSLAQHYITLLDDIGASSGSNSETKSDGSTSIEPSGPSSAFSKLPDESVLKIFLYLDLVSLCRCTRVCKQFCRLASDAMLYTDLGLKPYWNCVKGPVLQVLTPRCQYLQKLDLSWCGNYGSITPSDFTTFIKECGKLITHLKLDCCKFIDNSCIITVSDTCRHLKELTLRNVHSVSVEGYSSLSSISTLERLDFYRTHIETEPLVSLLKASPRLKHINLGSCVKISVMDEVANALGTYNRELVSADFWKTYSLTPVGVKALASCTLLEEIDLGWCLGVSIPGECLAALAAACPRLTKVFLAALRGLSDRDLAHFVVHCPHLRQLDLLGVRNITPNMCFRLLRECKELKLLDVSFCDQIPDPLVEWWSQQFTHVSIKKSYQSDGGVFIRNHP